MHGWQENVETTLCELEAAKHTAAVAGALKAGTGAIKSIQDAVSIAEVEKLMEQQADAYDWNEQVQSMLDSGALGTEDDVDEAAMHELEEMEAQMLQDELPEAPAAELPAAGEREPEREKGAAEAEELGLPDVPKADLPLAQASVRAEDDAGHEREGELLAA